MAHKLLLALRSEYFAALFRHHPDIKTTSLSQFDSALMKVIVKSLVDLPDENELTSIGLAEVITAANYLQMNDMVSFVSDIISSNLKIENLQAAIDLIQTIHSPSLN